jgi:hypothetical protein
MNTKIDDMKESIGFYVDEIDSYGLNNQEQGKVMKTFKRNNQLLEFIQKNNDELCNYLNNNKVWDRLQGEIENERSR